MASVGFGVRIRVWALEFRLEAQGSGALAQATKF